MFPSAAGFRDLRIHHRAGRSFQPRLTITIPRNIRGSPAKHPVQPRLGHRVVPPPDKHVRHNEPRIPSILQSSATSSGPTLQQDPIMSSSAHPVFPAHCPHYSTIPQRSSTMRGGLRANRVTRLTKSRREPCLKYRYHPTP